MLPEVVIVVSGTHWRCVTCKVHNKRTISLDQHLKQKHPYETNEQPTASVPAPALCDRETFEGVKDAVNVEYKTSKEQQSLSPIRPWLRQLPHQDFGEDSSDVVDADHDSDEDFVPSELENKQVKLPSRSRRQTRKQSKKTIKRVTVRILRVTKSKTKTTEQPLVNPDLVSEAEAASEVEPVSEFEPLTELEQTEPNDTEDEYKPKARRGRPLQDETVGDRHKPKARRGRRKISHNSPAQPQPARKRGRPPKPRPPPGEDQEMPPKRPYRKRVPDPSELLLKIRNVGRKPNTRKKLLATDKVGMKEKYAKWVSEGESAEALSKKNLAEGDESSLDNRTFGDRNGDSFISQDSMSSQDASCLSHENSNSGAPSRERVRCNICLNLFNSDRRLREHLRKVSSEDIIQCLQCEMKFHGMTDLNMHVFCDHEYEKQPMCFACLQEFKSMEKLEKHLYRHVEDKDRKLQDTRFHDCRLCSMELNIDFQLIKNHYYRRHKAYVCPECYGKTVELLYYTDTHLYAEHKQMHANSPAECVICKMVFPTSRDMKTHMWTHAEDKTEDGTGGKCSKCDMWLPNAGAMLMHEKEHKNEAIRKNYALEASIGFPCMKCEHIFSSKSNLKKHSCKADPNRAFYFHCEYCAHGCNTKEQLRDHIALHHLGIKRYACEYCDHRFVCAPTLRRHVRRQHTHEKPYECHLCGDRFYERNLMLRHVSKHTGIASFMCEFCGKGFHTKFDLKKHVENHTDSRDFVCPNCGLDYKRSYHLKRHLEKGCKKSTIQFDESVPSVASEAPLAVTEDDDMEISIDHEEDEDDDVDFNEDADMDNYNDESSGPDYIIDIDDDDDDSMI